jgi:hypothetical protein
MQKKKKRQTQKDQSFSNTTVFSNKVEEFFRGIYNYPTSNKGKYAILVILVKAIRLPKQQGDLAIMRRKINQFKPAQSYHGVRISKEILK